MVNVGTMYSLMTVWICFQSEGVLSLGSEMLTPEIFAVGQRGEKMDDKLTTKQAITVLRNLQDWLYYSSMNGGTSIQREAIDIAIGALIQLKTGKWKNIVDGIEYTWGTCDTCGAHIPMPYKYYEFCPHCGTKNEVEHG